MEDSVVRSITVQDVLNGSFKMPFTNRPAWATTQQDCPDLRRTHAHLSQGTRPSKKATKIPDTKRYLNQVTIARDGLIVVPESAPFHPTIERIVVPRNVLDGILTALHIKFSHPSRHQLKLVFNRYFFALDAEKGIDCVTSACQHCSSLQTIPQHFIQQSTSPPTDMIGRCFAVDIMRRYGQFIMVLRETVSSFTRTCIVGGEKREQLRDGLIMLLADMLALDEIGCTVRTDHATSFSALAGDPLLEKHGIHIDVGEAKNNNKNPIAERAIEELGLECLKHSPEDGPLSSVSLALITASLNARIRREGLSARELWTQRDQLTGKQLPIDDQDVILNQHRSRRANHSPSAKSKSKGGPAPPYRNITIGSLVYLNMDKDKNKKRDKYIIADILPDSYIVRKFTRDQFRSKAYPVKHSECYPIQSNVPSTIGPIRGLEHADSHEPHMATSDLGVPLMETEHTVCTGPPQILPDPPKPPVPVVPSLPPIPRPSPPAVLRDPPPAADMGPSPDRPTGNHTVAPPADTTTSGTPDSSTAADHMRASARSKKPPSWMTGDEWDLKR